MTMTLIFIFKATYITWRPSVFFFFFFLNLLHLVCDVTCCVIFIMMFWLLLHNFYSNGSYEIKCAGRITVQMTGQF